MEGNLDSAHISIVNERLGTTDVPIIRMRRILIDAAKGLAQAISRRLLPA